MAMAMAMAMWRRDPPTMTATNTLIRTNGGVGIVHTFFFTFVGAIEPKLSLMKK